MPPQPQTPLPASAYPPAYLREYNGDALRNVSYAFIFLVVAVVALRFYARTVSKSMVGLDDILIVIAAIPAIAVPIFCLVGIHVGFLGRHFPALDLTILPVALKHLISIICLYGVSITFAKLSILAFLLRIFPNKTFRRSVYFLMFITCCYCIEIILVVSFWCKPIAYSWDKTIVGGTCINQLAYFRYNTIPNILIDGAMLVLPLPSVWKLQTSTTQKLGLTVIFLTGIIGTITACIRMSVFFTRDGFEDQSWNAVGWLNWTIVEPGIYILAASLPSYRILVVAILVPWARTIRRSKSSEPSSNLVRGICRKEFIKLQSSQEGKGAATPAARGDGDQWQVMERDRDTIALNVINADREFDVHYDR